MVGAVAFFASNDRLGRPVSLPEKADEHALVGQRLFNMLCYAYGSDPSANKNLIANGVLTADRAARCPDEYAKIKKNWYSLLGAHLKKPFDTPNQETTVGGTVDAPRVPPTGTRTTPSSSGSGGGSNRGGKTGRASAPTCPVQPEPNYTDEARGAHIQGTVVLDAIIQKDGTIDVNKVERSLGYGLDAEAEKVLKKWKCNPGKLNGQPVAVQLQIVINFHLY
jgi:TonB family protein